MTRFQRTHLLSALSLLISLMIIAGVWAPITAVAQDWGDAPPRDPYEDRRYQDDGWGSPDAPPAQPNPYPTESYSSDSRNGSPNPDRPGWSARAGVGFTAAPESLHLNFEFPYSFDRWVSVGPSIQLGLDDDNTIVAPTLDINIRLADLEGTGFDRITPYGIVGIGFAVFDQDQRQNDNTDAGFLLNVGAGIEYQVSDHLYLGSQMKLNFLPFRTLGHKFFYSWQVGGVRIAF